MANILKYEKWKMEPVYVESIADYIPSSNKNKRIFSSHSIVSILIMLFVALNICSDIVITLN